MSQLYYSSSVDFYYVAAVTSYKKGKHKKSDGRFFIPSLGFSCRANSGSNNTKFCIPDGTHRCSNFRLRTDDDAMIREEDGVDYGFSVDIRDAYDPELQRTRTLMRIHPDGGLPGSAGCVAILDDLRLCQEGLSRSLPLGTQRQLRVVTVKSLLHVPETAAELTRR